MGKRYVYARNSPCLWVVMDTARVPAVPTCLVPEEKTDAIDSPEAARLCEILNRDHEMAEAVAAATKKSGGAP